MQAYAFPLAWAPDNNNNNNNNNNNSVGLKIIAQPTTYCFLLLSLVLHAGFFLFLDMHFIALFDDKITILSGLDKREDSDAEQADVMSGFIVLFCSSLVRMMKQML